MLCGRRRLCAGGGDDLGVLVAVAGETLVRAGSEPSP